MKETETGRAEWECEGGHIFCSACHSPAPTKIVRLVGGEKRLQACMPNVCPSCGAEMVGERKEK